MSQRYSIILIPVLVIACAAALSAQAALTITTPSLLPQATLGVPYTTALTASGGTPPYTWLLIGFLPPGLQFSTTTGIISGTATMVGSYTFTGRVIDAAGTTVTRDFSLGVVTDPVPVITNTSFPNAEVGTPYQVIINITGGCSSPFGPPPHVSVSNGAAPDGLSVKLVSERSYALTGIPTRAGVFSFTLQVTDSCNLTSVRAYQMSVAPGLPMTVTPSNLIFTMQVGSTTRPADQVLNIFTGAGRLDFTATVATSAGGNWLAIYGVAAGVTPAALLIGLAANVSLSPGVYNGKVIITSSAPNSPVEVPVTLNVLARPVMTAAPAELVFRVQVTSGSNISQQAFSLATGNAAVNFSISARTTTGAAGWLSVFPASGTTPATINAVVNSGGIVAGVYTGILTVTSSAANSPVEVPVTLEVGDPARLSASPASLAFRYLPGDAAPLAQTLNVGSSRSGLALTVSTSATWISATPVSAVTPASISVSVSPAGLAPGSYNGTVSVAAREAINSPLTVAVSLTVVDAPVIQAIAHAASYRAGPVAPGQLFTVFGEKLGPKEMVTLQLTPAGTVATNLGGSRVLIDGAAAPMVLAWDRQATAIMPYGVEGKRSVRLEVEYGGVRSAPQNVPITQVAPGIFSLDATGRGQGAILNEDGAVNGPQNGAAPGSIIVIYATGEGPTNPPGVDGKIAQPPLPKPLAQVRARVDGREADVIYAGGAPGLTAGVMQANVRLPENLPRGRALEVILEIGGVPSQPDITVFVRP